MKIMTLLGSPRPRGNTATILGWVEGALAEKGHSVERVLLPRLRMAGCLACAKCRRTMDEVGCVQTDDALHVLEKMIAADAVVFASPLYFWGFSSHMKTLMDRTYSLARNFHKPDHESMIQDQRQALVVSAADAYENNCEYAVGSFRRMVEFWKGLNMGELVATNCTTPEALAPEIEEKARELAARLLA